MKIYSITPNKFDRNIQQNNNITKNSINTNREEIKNSNLPSTQQYLAFTGGYSLDLAKTIERLDILAKKKSNLYPPNVREWAGMILEEGNKAKETLIDIHKKFYSSLKDCFSIEEVKQKFPEFKDVLSDDEVQFSKGTIFESFKNGELEYFDKDEDFSLQLIKLYWGEGFSLNDLKKDANGQDLYYTIKKFSIPTVDRDYGHILKLSDPEYNERLTKEMTQKRLAALDRKAQINDGEPLYIKRGPMSAEQKQKISEGLIRHYQEHPEQLLTMSERQKEFYRENPERAEIISRVTHKAWNIFGADRIKAAMSKFMKEKGFKDFDISELEQPFNLSKPKTSTLKQFWATNEWAKKSFSKNMEFAWKKVKEENEQFYIIDVTPNKFKEKFFKWAKGKGIDTNDLNFEMKLYPHKPEENDTERTLLSKYTRDFIDDNWDVDESSKMANTYFLAICNAAIELAKTNTNKLSPDAKNLREILNMYSRELLFESNGQCKVLEAPEAQAAYTDLLRICSLAHNQKLLDLYNKHLNLAYETIDKTWKKGQSILLPPEVNKYLLGIKSY